MNRVNAQAALAGLEAPNPEKKLKIHKDEDLETTVKALLNIFEKLPTPEPNMLTNYFELNEICLSLLAGKPEVVRIGYNRSYAHKFNSDFQITPKVISEFMLRAAAYQGAQNFAQNMGQYISALIQISYNQRYNNFNIDIRNLDKIDLFGALLVGRQDNKINVSVTGNLGGLILWHANRVRLEINGDFEDMCESIEDSTVILRGNTVGRMPTIGFLARNTDFTIYRKLRRNTEQTFDGAENCVIRCSSESELEKIKKVAGEGNKYYLLKDGKEVLFK